MRERFNVRGRVKVKKRTLDLSRHPRIRSSLASVQPVHFDAEAIKEEGWREHQILVIAQEDARLDRLERELVRQLGEKLYGRRPLPKKVR